MNSRSFNSDYSISLIEVNCEDLECVNKLRSLYRLFVCVDWVIIRRLIIGTVTHTIVKDICHVNKALVSFNVGLVHRDNVGLQMNNSQGNLDAFKASFALLR